jgi:UMF1 family MFS transporter
LAFGEVSFYNSYLPSCFLLTQQELVLRFYVWLRWLFNLLAFNLTMVMMPEWYGISDGSLPARIFIGWYLVDWFAQITFTSQ